MKKFPKLQSGFVSYENDELTEEAKYHDLMLSALVAKDFQNETNVGLYSPNVSGIYNEWRVDSSLIKNFEFRERILMAAKSSFNTKSFSYWLELQNLKGDISRLHKAFLIDTLEFIRGANRKVEVSQWIALIDRSVNTSSVKVDFASFFGRQVNNEIASAKMNDVIVTWTSRHGGFEDLLISLHVIFGSREYVSDVSENPTRQST
jgi:hypothetical protein